METFSVLLVISTVNSPVPVEFLTQMPVTLSFDVFFDLHLSKCLSKQSWGWWFETPSHPLWHQYNGSLYYMQDIDIAVASLTISEERSKVVDFPFPVSDSYNGAIITTRSKSKFFFMEPVNYSVWLMCCCMVILVTTFMRGFESFALILQLNESMLLAKDFCSILWMNVRTLLNQGEKKRLSGYVIYDALKK